MNENKIEGQDEIQTKPANAGAADETLLCDVGARKKAFIDDLIKILIKHNAVFTVGTESYGYGGCDGYLSFDLIGDNDKDIPYSYENIIHKTNGQTDIDVDYLKDIRDRI